MQVPRDVQGVQSVLGVANYLAKFTPKLNTVCEPLRRLLEKDSVFDCLPQHETAFNGIKEITQVLVLQYYDVNKEVSLECDSSEVGLGAVKNRVATLSRTHPEHLLKRSETMLKLRKKVSPLWSPQNVSSSTSSARRRWKYSPTTNHWRLYCRKPSTPAQSDCNECGFDFKHTLWTRSTNQDHRCISVTHYQGPHCQPLRQPSYSKYRSSRKSLNWKITASSLTTTSHGSRKKLVRIRNCSHL